MSFLDCIGGKVAQKLITKAQAEALQKKHDALTYRYSLNMSDVRAAAMAAERVVSVEAEVIAQKSRNKIQTALSQKEAYDKIKAAVDEKLKIYDGLNWAQKAVTPKPSADKEIGDMLHKAYVRTNTVKQQHLRQMADFIEQYSSKAFGLKQDTVGIRDVVRSMLGADVKDAALTKLGADIRSVFDSLHSRFRAAGGIIGKIPNYFPQVHEAGRLRAVSGDDWKAYITPLLDRERMINESTGLPYTDDELGELLDSLYNNVTTNGLDEFASKVAEGKAPVGKARDVAARQNDKRFVRFKDADSFLAYNDKFGVGEAGLYDAIIGHIGVMSREIGIMEKISPNANAFMKFADALMQSEGISKTKANFVKGQYDVLSGRLAGNGNESAFYKAVMGYQNIHRAAVLGAAPISAMTDSMFSALALRANGISGVRGFAQWVKQLNPANAQDRRAIQRMLFISESSLGSGYQAARMSDDLSGGGKFLNTTRAISGITHRASGLAYMTEATMNSAALEVAGRMADLVLDKTAWDTIEPALQEAMIRNGIDEAAYNIMQRATPSDVGSGATFLRAEDILALKDVDSKEAMRVANALDDWYLATRMLAANEPTLATRAITTGAALGDAQAGTALRAITSSVMMYKGFSITMFNNFLRPALANAAAGRAGDLGIMAVGGTLLGAVAYQLKEMSKGKEPMPMDNAKFWRAAMLQGGGLGYFGEFMFKDVNGYGRSLQTELAGPLAGTLNDVMKLADLDNEKFISDVGNMIYRHIPGQSLWYGRLIAERYIKDTFNRMTDSDFDARIRRTEKKLQSETGQGYWFRPGTYAPQ